MNNLEWITSVIQSCTNMEQLLSTKCLIYAFKWELCKDENTNSEDLLIELYNEQLIKLDK